MNELLSQLHTPANNPKQKLNICFKNITCTNEVNKNISNFISRK